MILYHTDGQMLTTTTKVCCRVKTKYDLTLSLKTLSSKPEAKEFSIRNAQNLRRKNPKNVSAESTEDRLPLVSAIIGLVFYDFCE